ncbi:4096_t:CDS:10 [Scutellospora calospora]|uniref:4096_t:CDS:1 n=1 Tax=Scutellospora calospora TaxID=85575 RepID=A0ACA9K7B5_9GLOM|nr:4096_t:CDS:10 [Scutellospora calospora]
MIIVKKFLILYVLLWTISLVIALPQKRSIQKRAIFNTDLFTAFTPQPATTAPTVRTYDFYLQRVSLAPDGISRNVWAVNGQYPGPIILANKGDQIMYNVINNLGEPVTIHSHGILQTNSNFYDGVPGVTQCPIPNGANFTYNFTVSESGTYWYHSHYISQYVDGLFGPLIVQDPADPRLSLYDYEYVVFLNDWYHNTSHELLAAKMVPSYQGVSPVPDSVLISGLGQYNCSAAKGVPCNSSVATPTYVVTSGKRYRFRIINSSADTHFHFSIDNHELTLIEADGINIQPSTIRWLPINIGQRYSVIVNASQPVGNYFIRSSATMACMLPAATMNVTINYNSAINWNATGILHYVGAANNSAPTSTQFPYPDSITGVNCTDVPDENLIPLVADAPPTNISRSNSFTYNITFGPDPVTQVGVFFINGNSFSPNLTSPTLMQLDSGVNPQSFPSNQSISSYEAGGVEIIFINNMRDAHPFHQHGHNFYILGRGNGTVPDPSTYNLVNPPVRDTATVQALGWMTIRYLANNPGIWLLHCHIEWHAEMGMVIQLVERPNDLKQLTVPSNSSYILQAVSGTSCKPSLVSSTSILHDSEACIELLPISSALTT